MPHPEPRWLDEAARVHRPGWRHSGYLAAPRHARNSRESCRPSGFWVRLRLPRHRQATKTFLRRLHELGWIEGRTVMIEYRWVEGRSERYAEIAAEFVRLQGKRHRHGRRCGVLAVKEATSVIPIVFPAATDPLGSGVVASLARPGGNITGLSSQSADTARKQLELLREVVPDLRRLAIMANGGNPSACAGDARCAGGSSHARP